MIALTEEEANVFVDLFKHPAGMEARSVIERKFVNVDGFDKDPFQHAFNAGKRAVGLLLLAMASADRVLDVEDIDKLDNDYTEG